jgi:4-hydroxybenzoate polyprenyltransferase
MNLANLWAYLCQRFPPVNMALFAVLFLTVWSVGQTVTAGGRAAGWAEGIGIATTVSFFFRLRVFDEIKDFALDAQNHPQRILQQGRVTLPQLRTLAWAGAVLELGWSASRGKAALLGWGLVLAYSLGMRYEFFVPAWLRARLLLYALTHMLIMPLVIAWLWGAYAPYYSAKLLALMLLSLLGGFAFELARKTHAPAAERPAVDSYSQLLGLGGAVAGVGVVLLAGVGVQVWLLRQLGAPAWPYVVLGSLLTGTLLVYGRALAGPAETWFRRAEIVVSLFLLSSYLCLIIHIHGTVV